MLRILSWLNRNRNRNRNRVRGERGVALPMVVGIGAVLFILVATALSISVSSAKKSVSDEDWNAASAAAYAGIADYQSRLVNDNTYYKFGNPAAPFSASSASTLRLPTGALENPAFSIGQGGAWVPVSGATGDAAYRYEVDNSQYQTRGQLRVRATGRAGTATRSVIANVRQKGFIDFLYLTDYETQDPAITGKDQVLCTQRYPARPEGNGPGQCGQAIQFRDGETVNGPVHSNDALYICGGTFEGRVTSFYSTSPYYRDCGNARFEGGDPEWADEMGMPPTNSQLRAETQAGLDDVPRPGCLYTGPTTITFNGNGTMTVRSPWTKHVNTRAGSPPTGVANSLCGTPGTGSNGLGTANGATIDVLVQNLVYVQTIPNTATDPNYWATGANPTGFTCPASGNGLGFPLKQMRASNPARVEWEETSTTAPQGSQYYDCRAGDAFVKGTVDAAMTIASENYVWVTGDLVYKDRATHILGLIAQNAVWVWNPYGRQCTNWRTDNSCRDWNASTTLLTDSTRRIDAAMLSVQHTFQVQNFDIGQPRGNLAVYGAIAQKYRGTVGQSSGGSSTSGYSKQYDYDLRLRRIAPPKFLSPVSTTYGTSQFAEVAAAFKADGTTIP